MTETIDALNVLEFEVLYFPDGLLSIHELHISLSCKDDLSAMGVVTLLSGQPKEGLSVEARSDLKGSYEETVTDSSGSYHLRGLHPDTSYTIRVYENSRWCTEWRSKNDSVVKLDDSDEIRICEDSDEIRICCTENDNVVKLDDSSPVLKQGEGKSKTNVTKTISSVLADDFVDVLSFTEFWGLALKVAAATVWCFRNKKSLGKFTVVLDDSIPDLSYGSRDGSLQDDVISKEDSEDVDDEGIVEKPVKVNLPKVSPNGSGVSTNWIYFTVRQSTTRRRLLPAIYEASGGFD
ncbi:hypothetical protein Tco_1005550 [Tanacetum coccineum]|uniref:Carboxypeptidase regulatory-like domain-containing protein n=1 Tax=Tanacetum coccineum TaxID=301880 RepID=A0ABQ5FHI3_9ASTR